MTQDERRVFLIEYLLKENPLYKNAAVPKGETAQKRLLRSLLNVREPKSIGEDFLKEQDEYLKNEIAKKGVTDFRDLTPSKEGIYLWRGDITTIRADAIVNAANGGLTGCYVPCHGCVDNAIHTYSGVELRLSCKKIMDEQGEEEKPGGAKITKAYNLPSKYIIHTVGPVVFDKPTKEDADLLASCYRSSIETAKEYNIKSLVFCSISTGEFHFPKKLAAEIALDTVTKHRGDINAVFNVFSEEDYEIYKRVIG